MAVARRGEKTGEEIRAVALDLFFKRGFQAMTLRDAGNVGIQVGSLHNHIASKGALRFEIMESVMLDLLEDRHEAAKTSDVVERMRLLVDHHVKFHGRRANEVFVGNSELRSLRPAQRARIIALRDQYELVFRKELEDGIRQGKFLPVDVQVTAYGILAMATSRIAWASDHSSCRKRVLRALQRRAPSAQLRPSTSRVARRANSAARAPLLEDARG
jgi:AcrR family transcriptional regulator